MGVFTGTLSITPSLTSRSRPSVTILSQCKGTAAGLWTATGEAFSFKNRRKGGLVFIRGKGCCSHVLNAEAAYLSTMYWRKSGRLSDVGAQGMVGGASGGNSRCGQEQGRSSGPDTPELEQVIDAIVIGGEQLPMVGKSFGIRPKSLHASLDKNV